MGACSRCKGYSYNYKRMILLFIAFISFIQFLIYFIIQNYQFKIYNISILALTLIGHWMLFPQLFFPEPKTDGINCGMPLLGVLFGFWIFGTIAAIITHVIWKNYISSFIEPVDTK